MTLYDEIADILDWSQKSEDFVIDRDDFADLEINATPTNANFYYFYHRRERRLIKQFVLDARAQVDYLCIVTLIKTDDKFKPRISVSVRDKQKQIVEGQEVAPTNIRANVSLDECHENFWKLISFIQSLQNVVVPLDKFSLIPHNDAEIVAALRGREPGSVKEIIQQLATAQDLSLTQKDMNVLMKRRDKLAEFEAGLRNHADDEGWWQAFMEQNKWIFGYGLNYVILRQEQAQPHYGGVAVNGRGGQRGDNLMATVGDLRFTVLVELKTPVAHLLQGADPIRNGAYSLSKGLTDAVAQIQANIQTWERVGAGQDANRDRFESAAVYTVNPKGIIVIGSLSGFGEDRNKRETFERFRTSIHGIDIITYDELLARARFIVENE